LFIGLAVDTTALITADPSSKLNTLGFAVDSADTAISFLYIMMVLVSQLKTLLSDNQPYLVIMLMMRIYSVNQMIRQYSTDLMTYHLGLTIIDTSTAIDLPISTMLNATAQ
jgi:hypothetical protein